MHIPVVSGWPGFLGFGILLRHSPSWRREGVHWCPAEQSKARFQRPELQGISESENGGLTSSACSSVGILFSKRLSLNGSDVAVREKLERKKRNIASRVLQTGK